MSPIKFCYLHSFSVKLQHVLITHTTMALQVPVNPAQQTQAIVALKAGLYLTVSVSRDIEAVLKVVIPAQVSKNRFFAPFTRYF